jgi:hypothetical protein
MFFTALGYCRSSKYDDVLCEKDHLGNGLALRKMQENEENNLYIVAINIHKMICTRARNKQMKILSKHVTCGLNILQIINSSVARKVYKINFWVVLLKRMSRHSCRVREEKILVRG